MTRGERRKAVAEGLRVAIESMEATVAQLEQTLREKLTEEEADDA